MKVRISLEPNQTPEQAEEELFKAMEAHRAGTPHDSGAFPDPAMQNAADVMKAEYKLAITEMMREIEEVLDEPEEH